MMQKVWKRFFFECIRCIAIFFVWALVLSTFLLVKYPFSLSISRSVSMSIGESPFLLLKFQALVDTSPWTLLYFQRCHWLNLNPCWLNWHFRRSNPTKSHQLFLNPGCFASFAYHFFWWNPSVLLAKLPLSPRPKISAIPGVSAGCCSAVPRTAGARGSWGGPIWGFKGDEVPVKCWCFLLFFMLGADVIFICLFIYIYMYICVYLFSYLFNFLVVYLVLYLFIYLFI